MHLISLCIGKKILVANIESIGTLMRTEGNYFVHESLSCIRLHVCLFIVWISYIIIIIIISSESRMHTKQTESVGDNVLHISLELAQRKVFISHESDSYSWLFQVLNSQSNLSVCTRWIQFSTDKIPRCTVDIGIHIFLYELYIYYIIWATTINLYISWCLLDLCWSNHIQVIETSECGFRILNGIYKTYHDKLCFYVGTSWVESIELEHIISDELNQWNFTVHFSVI